MLKVSEGIAWTTNTLLLPFAVPLLTLRVTDSDGAAMLICPVQTPPTNGPAVIGVTVPVVSLNTAVPTKLVTTSFCSSSARIVIANGIATVCGLLTDATSR